MFVEFFPQSRILTAKAHEFFQQGISEVNYTVHRGAGDDPIRHGKYMLNYLSLRLEIVDGGSMIGAKRLMDYDLLLEALKGIDEYFSEEIGEYLSCYFHLGIKGLEEKWERVGKGAFRPSRRPHEAVAIGNGTDVLSAIQRAETVSIDRA